MKILNVKPTSIPAIRQQNRTDNNIKDYREDNKNLEIKSPDYFACLTNYSLAGIGHLNFKSSEIDQNWNVQPKITGEVRDSFNKFYRFEPAQYQQEAAALLFYGNNTIVPAPTGSGKTLTAEYAIAKNLDYDLNSAQKYLKGIKDGDPAAEILLAEMQKEVRDKGDKQRTFYTTPLKALSEQKYRDFCELFGKDNVGIMTGDRSVNGNAPIIVMTTEIYRNMAANNTKNNPNEQLDNLKTVVFDEFHYMNDYERGWVWEESIMRTPQNVQMLLLSATASNVQALQNWIGQITQKPVGIAGTDKRSVPLEYYSYRPNGMELKVLAENEKSQQNGSKRKPWESVKHYITDLTLTLEAQGKLPAILFVFSKRQSQEALETFSDKNISLLSKEEEGKVEQAIKQYEDKGIFLGVDFDRNALKKGIAVHNAGMLPAHKNLVEKLFQQGLIKVVLATETLAAGINMPAKTTVITSMDKPSPLIGKLDTMSDDEKDRLTKEAGSTSVLNKFCLLNATEFHQMTGRAGRWGIDETGNVVIVDCGENFVQEAQKLIKSESNPIKSRFKPTYAYMLSFFNKANDFANFREELKKTFMCNDMDTPAKERETIVKDFIDEFKRKQEVLINLGFIEKVQKNKNAYRDDIDKTKFKNTLKGNLASKINCENEIHLTELILTGNLDNLGPAELAALSSILTDVNYKNIKGFDEGHTLSINPAMQTEERDVRFQNAALRFKLRNLNTSIDRIKDIKEKIDKAQADCKISSPDAMTFDFQTYPYIYKWASAEQSSNEENLNQNWKEMIIDMQSENIIFSEGDFTKLISSTVNVLNQISDISLELSKAMEKNTPKRKLGAISDSEKYKQISKNAQEAVRALQKPPAWDDLSEISLN